MTTRKIIVLTTISLLPVSLALSQSARPVYKNPKAAVEERINDLLPRMTLEEKIAMIGGTEGFYIRGNERLGIPKIRMADGPLGVRNGGKSTAFPAGINMAATWNVDLERKVGEAVGNEARAKGVHIMLAPGVNIYRSPLCGRNFEYFGEDPWLASRMTVAYIKGVQSKGVVATVKHFDANNSEYDRHNISSDIDERTLHEIYLPNFEAAVTEARVGAVMNSYNLVNGVHASQNHHLLTDILKDQWKFDGFVMSDWSSTYDGVAAANAGLDLEMPSAEFMNAATLDPSLKTGAVAETTIDDKIRRMLRVMFRFGFFDREQMDSTIQRDSPASRAVALRASEEGIVLLKNKDNVLPFSEKAIKSIAIVGPNASPAVYGGGGSSEVQPFRAVSLVEGVKARVGVQGSGFEVQGKEKVKVNFVPWPTADIGAAADFSEYWNGGLEGQYFANMNMSGTPVMTRNDRRINFEWGDGSPDSAVPSDSFSVMWQGNFVAPSTGKYEFLIRGDDGYRVAVDNIVIIDQWHDQSATTSIETKELLTGNHPLRIEYYEHGGGATVQFGWRRVERSAQRQEVRAASESDAAVVCVGFNDNTEGEGFDRPFELPREQVELINAVAAVNKKTVVVLMAGGNVQMANWIDKVAGVVEAWYPGEEGGNAIAHVLFGDVNPSGKLPATFEKRWEDNPTFATYHDPDGDGHVKYSEGIFMGYRGFQKMNAEPMFPFGYGLSYTTFAYRDLKISKKNDKVVATFRVKNTGTRDGSEVAQVYVHAVKPSVEMPEKELKGFQKVWLKSKDEVEVKVELGPRAFSYYDSTTGRWKMVNGGYEIWVGSSSRDIRLRSGVLE